MLQKRVTTALIMVPVALIILFLLPVNYFLLTTAIILLVAVWEWTSICNCSTIEKYCYLILCCFFATLAVYYNNSILTPIISIWWSIVLLLILTYPSCKKFINSKVIYLLAGMFTLIPAWLSLKLIKQNDVANLKLIWIIGTACIADIGAYFSGKLFGKTKLAKHVSPAKTIEGLAGGLLLAICCSSLFCIWQNYNFIYSMKINFYTMIMVFIAVIGDLWESLIKRAYGVKDSSNLLPGHGGVLDRLDSHIAVLSLFAITYM